MTLTPELNAHIREILKQLKSQGPQDPAVSFIIKSTIGSLCRSKLQAFTAK
jgi:hypothetical protein